MELYRKLASSFEARLNCESNGNSEWFDVHTESIETIMSDAPSGSGFDNGTDFNYEKSRPERLVLNTAFHHMNEHGHYEGWTEHAIVITPSLAWGFDMRVTGKDRDGIKDYIGEQFVYFLAMEIA